MSRRSTFSTAGLVSRHLRSGIGGSLLVALLVASAVFAVALAPRALPRLGTAELRHELSDLSPALLDLTGTGRIGIVAGLSEPITVDDLFGNTDRGIHKIPASMPDPLDDHLGDISWVSVSGSMSGELPDRTVPLQLKLSLAVDLEWESRIRFVEGGPPEAWQGSELDDVAPVDRPPIGIALSAAAAEQLHLEVGDVVGYLPAPVLIVGIYEPLDPTDAYWIHMTDLDGITLDQSPGQLTVARAIAYVDPLSIVGLQDTILSGKLHAWIPVDPSGFDYADAIELQTQVRKVAAAQVALPNFGDLSFRSGLPEVIDRAIAKVTAASSLLALSVSGLLGVLLAVFALGVQSVITRRRPTLALAAARGAGEVQLRGTMVLEGLIISLPGSAIAIAAAALVIPQRVGIEAWVLPVAVALAPPILFGAMTSGRELRAPRSDLRVRSRSRSRWVAEVAVVGLAALSLFLLARRGLVATSEVVGIDPLLAATPLLLAAAVCIGVLRLYPVPLLGVQGRLRKRRGAVGVLGAARAIRDPALGFAAALALVVGITIVVFSAVMATTLRSGLEQAAKDEVGADVQVKAEDLGPRVVDAIDAIDGVSAAVSIAVQSGVVLRIGPEDTEVFVVLVDSAALHDARPDIPSIDAKVGGAIPILISSEWANRVESPDLRLAGLTATIVGEQPPDAVPGATRHWVMVDAGFAEDLTLTDELVAPQRVIVRLDDPATAAELAPEIADVVSALQPEAYRGLVVVSDIETELSAARASPTVAGLENALLIAGVASLLLTMLTVVLSSVAAATARNRTVGVLRILGMSGRQLRSLSAWELGPVAITAVVIGTALRPPPTGLTATGRSFSFSGPAEACT